jgi:hypothetical protein
MSIEILAAFLGWCTVINIVILLVVLLFIWVLHDWFGTISARIFGVSSEQAKATFFQVVQQYRFAIVFLNLVPYLALRIMA